MKALALLGLFCFFRMMDYWFVGVVNSIYRWGIGSGVAGVEGNGPGVPERRCTRLSLA